MGLTLDEAEAEAEVLEVAGSADEEAPLPVEEAPAEFVDEGPVAVNALVELPVKPLVV